MHFSAKKFGAKGFFSYLCTKCKVLRMKKSILKLSLIVAMTIAIPVNTWAESPDPFIVEQTIDDDINISVNGQTVTVTGAQGFTLEVVSLTGRKVMSVKIESPAQRVELNIPKGCYILKIGKVVRKVSIH
jgi:hypothetical protein